GVVAPSITEGAFLEHSEGAEQPAQRDFYDLSRDELAAVLKERFDAPSYRATQLFEWVYRSGVTDPSQMTNLPEAFRSQLAGAFTFPTTVTRERHISSDGTRKYL